MNNFQNDRLASLNKIYLACNIGHFHTNYITVNTNKLMETKQQISSNYFC